jgi:hypothetical protein
MLPENRSVGGSIPPLGTTLRPSGYAWRSHAGLKGEACPAKLERSESEESCFDSTAA